MAIASSAKENDLEYSDFEELWIAACAVYPVLRWPLTVQIGRELARRKGKPVPDLDAHVPLARHTWFRAGRIPDNARAGLIDGLEPGDRRIVHAVYQKVFQRMDGEQLHSPLSAMDADDPLFTRFMQGERWGEGERRRDERLWKRMRMPVDVIDLRVVLALSLAVCAAIGAGIGIFLATKEWREPGEPTGGAVELPAMVALPGGTFQMGSPDATEGSDEWPQHAVTVARFAMAKFEVTRGQYNSFLEASGHRPDGVCVVLDADGEAVVIRPNPDTGRFDDRMTSNAPDPDRHPAACVSWDDAQAYLAWLNDLTGLTNSPERYRLPSEAEWEYAARANNPADFYWSRAEPTETPEPCGYANHLDRSFQVEAPPGASVFDCTDGFPRSAPVGRLLPNAFGLHDMSGNVWEWVEDCWHDTYEGAPTDGRSWLTDNEACPRVLRGGSWYNGPQDLRSAGRDWLGPGLRSDTIGFRPARTLLTL